MRSTKVSLNTIYNRNSQGIMRNFPVRFIRRNLSTYLRKEDVIDMINEIAATEETDVRNRFAALMENLEKVGFDKVGV
jgi:hypothetical protein